MADDELINQDEIEALLAQARDGGASEPPAAESSAPAAAEPMLDQSEIEALISGAPSTENPGAPHASLPPEAAPPATSAAATAAAAATPAATSDVELLLNKAEAAIASIDEPLDGLPDGVSPFSLDDFSGTPPNREAATLELVRDVQLDLRIELGRTRMHLEDVLRLRKGAVVPLDKLAGDPVDIFVNGRLIARGEVLVLNDNFCVRITELVAGESAVA